MSDFRADVDTRSYMIAMRALGRDALPGAVADALNAPAAAIEKRARSNVKRQMTVRTPFTLNSIRHDRRARGANIGRMFSRVGSISPYLAIHDEGGVIRAKRRRVAIPTLQARVGRNISRRISGKYALGRYDDRTRFFTGRPKGGNRPLGIYERYQSNKRLRMIRNLESDQVRIRRRDWFSEPVRRYGTRQFITAQFKGSAQRRIAAATRRGSR
jgi:hypothetical protein